MSLICELPYNLVQINEFGDVFPCCSFYCGNYSFGNILESPFSKIWNGEKAKNFRRQLIDKTFKYCNLEVCLPHRSDCIIEETEIADKRPASVLLGYDRTCNVKCIFCTPLLKNKSYQKKFENIENWYSDLFYDVKHVNVSCSGELFASKHCRELTKRIVQLYPDIKFDVTTNGLLFNETNLIELGIKDSLSTVGISFHSLNKKVYEKLVLKSNFDTVMKNVKYAIELKKQNKIKNLEFRFVITSYNYKEMIKFAKYAKENNARCVFMECIQYNMNSKLYKKLNILDANHSNYNSFIRLIRHPILKEDFVSINKSLFDLKPVSFLTSIKNKLISTLPHYIYRC